MISAIEWPAEPPAVTEPLKHEAAPPHSPPSSKRRLGGGLRIAGSVVVLFGVSYVAISAPAVRLVVSNDLCLVEQCIADYQPPPRVATSGLRFDLVVVAVDAADNHDSNYSGTVSFASSDPGATLPGTYTFVPSDQGGKAFSATLIAIGDQTITVTDPTGNLTGTLTMRVRTASLLSLTSFPNPSRTSSPFTLTATVSGSGPVPTGTVTFSSNLCAQPCAHPSFPVGSASLDSTGRASLIFPGFADPGSYGFEARYGGDSNYGESSGGLFQVVIASVPMLDVRALVLLGVLLTASGVLLLRKGNG
jgi:hypothetical protein